jgi:hypothetical protein
MCAFTYITGQFEGGGEAIQIRSELINGVERWVLRSKRGGASDYIAAKARCYAASQL